MTEVYFNGPCGRIEGRYIQSKNPKAPVALILHPHPLHGGTMNNKVVYNIYKTLVEKGFTALRINFRGVGRSLGTFDNGIGEMTDAATALDWLQLNNPLVNIYVVVGFSFGAWIGMQLIMRRPEITNFLVVSPPVVKYDFSFLSPCPISGMVIHGDQDSVVSEDDVHAFTNKISKQKHITIDYRMVSGADHFFRDKIDILCNEIKDYVTTTFPNIEGSSVTKNSDNNYSNNKKLFLE